MVSKSITSGSFMLALTVLAVGDVPAEILSSVVSKTVQDYSCLADSMSLVETIVTKEGGNEQTKININIDPNTRRTLTWLVDKSWKGDKLNSEANVKITFLEAGIYDKANGKPIGSECPVVFESLNFDLYDSGNKSGCTLTPPVEGDTVWACSIQNLTNIPVSSGAADFPSRAFCASFKFTTKGLYAGLTTPMASDATFSPIDFKSLCGGRTPNGNQSYGITMQVDTRGAIDPALGNGEYDAELEITEELMQGWWQRGNQVSDSNVKVTSKITKSQTLKTGTVKTTTVYYFEGQGQNGQPVPSVANWQ